ncbi:MAG: hypothetical protein Q9222_006912, partial [Ikaeria aurantiellina]
MANHHFSISNSYKLYRSLEPTNFRLLTIHPGLKWTPITCTLSGESLEKPLEYDALSYTWGDATEVAYITLNSIRTEIRLNLALFLQRLLRDGRVRVVWLDLLCINQHDAEEKGDQVSKKATIFSKARAVLSWLCEHDASSLYAYGQPTYLQHWDSLGLSEEAARDFAWNGFLNRAYWTRTWIVQEVAFGKVVQLFCGDDIMDWSCLRDMVRSCGVLDTSSVSDSLLASTKNISRLDELRRHILDHSATPPSLTSDEASPYTHPYLINSYLPTQCTVPRDKIFALLSLVSSGYLSYAVKPDYNIEDWDLFGQFYLKLLRYISF